MAFQLGMGIWDMLRCPHDSDALSEDARRFFFVCSRNCMVEAVYRMAVEVGELFFRKRSLFHQK